jgi:hypothetical protein
MDKADRFWSCGIADELWTCSHALLDAARRLPDPIVGLLRRSALEHGWPAECAAPVLARLRGPVLNPGEPWADAVLADLPSLGEPWLGFIDLPALAGLTWLLSLPPPHPASIRTLGALVAGPPLRTSLTGTSVRALARITQQQGHPELERLLGRARHKVTQRQICEALMASDAVSSGGGQIPPNTAYDSAFASLGRTREAARRPRTPGPRSQPAGCSLCCAASRSPPSNFARTESSKRPPSPPLIRSTYARCSASLRRPGSATPASSTPTHGRRRRIRLQHGDIVTDHHAHLLAAIVELGGELELPATRNGRFRGAVIPEGCAVSADRRRCGGRRPVR